MESLLTSPGLADAKSGQHQFRTIIWLQLVCSRACLIASDRAAYHVRSGAGELALNWRGVGYVRGRPSPSSTVSLRSDH